jgi:PAS domain S-box-containing protein
MPSAQKRLLRRIDTQCLIDSSPIAHYLAQPAGSHPLTFVSAAAEESMGFGPDRFTADADFWLSRVHPDDRPQAALGRAAVMDAGTHSHEYRFQHADGAWRWIHDEGTLIRDEAGAPLAISGVWLDVTDRKLAEVSLRQQKEFLSNLIENAPTIVLILDERGRISRINPYFEKLSGFSAAEMIGNDWFETLLPQMDRGRIRELFQEVLKRGMIAGSVSPIAAKNGKTFEIEWFAQVLTTPSGRFNGLLCVGYDVTDRIEYEKALETSKREAERARTRPSRGF